MALCDWLSTWCSTPTLPYTPLQLCENVSQQDFTERLVKLCEHVTDSIQSVVARCRHPLGFLEACQKQTGASVSKVKDTNSFIFSFILPSVTSDLRLLLGEFHVVKDAEDNPEEVVPPVFLKGVAVALHDLKHDCETSVTSKDKQFRRQAGSVTAQQKHSRQRNNLQMSVNKWTEQCWWDILSWVLHW